MENRIDHSTTLDCNSASIGKLADATCKNATCPTGRSRARYTDGRGLYLEVSPNGSKRWFLKLYPDGKETRMALGSYPTVTLAAARKARGAAKLQKADGTDPVQAKKMQRAQNALQLKSELDRLEAKASASKQKTAQLQQLASPIEIADYAARCANKAYEEAIHRATHGLVSLREIHDAA